MFVIFYSVFFFTFRREILVTKSVWKFQIFKLFSLYSMHLSKRIFLFGNPLLYLVKLTLSFGPRGVHASANSRRRLSATYIFG